MIKRLQSIKTPSGEVNAKTFVYIHENGSLKNLPLYKDTVLEGRKFHLDMVVGWDRSGNFLGEMVWSQKNMDYFVRD